MKVQKHIKKIKKALGTKSSLDFEHKCVFRNQLSYRGLSKGNGEIIEVPMESGKWGLYKVTSERYNIMGDDTGQRNFYFKLLKYKKL